MLENATGYNFTANNRARRCDILKKVCLMPVAKTAQVLTANKIARRCNILQKQCLKNKNKKKKAHERRNIRRAAGITGYRKLNSAELPAAPRLPVVWIYPQLYNWSSNFRSGFKLGVNSSISVLMLPMHCETVLPPGVASAAHPLRENTETAETFTR